MANSQDLSPIDLTGADCFLRAIDGEVRRTAGAGHLAQLVLRMGPGFSVDGFSTLLRDVAAANPIMRAPIRRRGWLATPRYLLARAAAPQSIAVDVHDGGERSETLPPQAFVRRLNSTIASRKGPLIAADVATYADGRADVALTWLHLLLDGAGSERFVEHLAHCSADAGCDRSVAVGSAPAPTLGSLRQRGDQASAWHRALVGDGGLSIQSPAGPLGRTPQKLHYRWTKLERDQTDLIKARSHQLAGILTPTLFYLAAAIRGHQAVARSRGHVPDKWLVPLPVNLRPKGAEGETFRTQVSLIWFQATASEADDFEGLVETLKRQRRATIKGGLIEAGVAAMDFVRWIPGRLFTKLARRDYCGELCSFFFAFTDEFAPAAERLCGARIETGSHVPSVPPSPGSSVVMTLRDGCLTLTQIRQYGAVSDEEDEIMREQILADLLGR